MKSSTTSVDRRSFLKGAALLGGAAAALGVTGCAPQAQGSADQALSTTGDDVAWDEECDFLVVGGGCGTWGALMAAQTGASVTLVDKNTTFGGTTAMSGNGMWVPGSWLMADAAKENPEIVPDTEADVDATVEYVMSSDPYGAADRDLVEDYVRNVAPALQGMGEALGVKFCMGFLSDYYNLPGMKYGRQINFANDEGTSLGYSTFAELVQPLVDQHGVNVQTNTEAVRLYQDGEGRVVGAQVSDGSKTKNIKAAKGVLLNTGGFDFNEGMVKSNLRGPIVGSNAVPTNTGDGHRMGVEVGAALGNMASFWGTPFYITSDDAALSENLVDWMAWRGGDHSIIVNKYGKRFHDETCAYAPATLAFHQYNTAHYGLDNIPGFHIGDQSFVSLYGYPGASAAEGETPEMPSWVKTYDTLEALAADNGIDAEALVAEVARWNAFCDQQRDEDFSRPSSIWPEGPFFAHDEANPCFGKIETAPFFCAKIGPGTCGTSGGLKVNADAQVVNTQGEVIEGLYASGNCSCGFFGSAYPGPGSTVGSGVYRAIRAANHAFDLGLV